MAEFKGEERRENSYVTRHQALTIAHEAGTHAAKEVLEGFGIYASTPEAKAEYRKDMEHVRNQRNACSSVKAKGLVAAVGIVTVGILATLWMGLKATIKTGIH